MLNLWLAPLLAFGVSLALVGLLVHTRLGLRLAPDAPNHRSLHTKPVPRVGGLGIVAGTAVAAGVSQAPSAIVALMGALCLVSLLDDMLDLAARTRFAAHLAAAGLFVLTLPGLPLWLALPLILAVAWHTNLYNFMDGANGLAGGMTAIGFAALGLAAWQGGDMALAGCAGSISAAALAFLLFNFHPARIFMGDCGSIPLGFAAAALGIHGWHLGLWSPWLPLLTFSPFIADATVTLIRRIARGERFWQPHREHYYQRLIRMGWSHRRLALVAYGLMAIAAALGSVIQPLSADAQALVGGIALMGYWPLFRAIDRIWREHPAAAAS